MYGYVSDKNGAIAGDIILGDSEEFEQLKAQFPEHEVYLFAGNEVDIALFCAPGILAMLVESRASPGKNF